MNDSILATLQQHLGPDTIRQMSSAVGADPDSTAKAVSLALPTILSGLSGNAARPEGAQSLDRALDQHDGSILDNLGGMLGGGGGGGLGGMLGGMLGGGSGGSVGGDSGGGLGGMLGADGPGGAILGHIFGTKRAPVEAGVGKASGMSAAQVAQLMAMLAPIVMGVLGRMKREKGLDANRLPDVLQQSAPADDGFGLDDLVRMGSGALGGMFGNKR